MSSSFSAAAFGEVSIGDAETTALFDLSDMQPGDTQSACFVATVTEGSAVNDWRIYSGGVTGDGLEDYINLTIRLEAVTTDGTPPGISDCSGFVTDTVPVAGTLGAYAASTSTFLDGDSLGAQTTGVANSVRIWLIFQLPETPDVWAHASGLTASTSWIVENQT